VIAEAAGYINRYPDNGAVALTEAIAGHFGVPPEHVAVGCGSVGVTQQLLEAAGEPGAEVVYAWRSFEAYPLLVSLAAADETRVPLRDHTHDLDAMAAMVTAKTRLVFICNPNNPTGTAVRRDEMERFLTAVGPDVLVALDEAYHEYVFDPDVADGMDLVDAHPNLVVLRTFSKAYRLAGLRVGYAVGAPEVAEALRKVCSPFSVSTLAQAAATAALDCRDELLAACAGVVEERLRVRAALVAAGFSVPETQSNFVWLALGDRTAEFAAHCLEHKVVVRPFHPEGVRVTVSVPEENDAFLAAAASFTGRAE
jgi:histidinol-phosphate aminotransferase